MDSGHSAPFVSFLRMVSRYFPPADAPARVPFDTTMISSLFLPISDDLFFSDPGMKLPFGYWASPIMPTLLSLLSPEIHGPLSDYIYSYTPFLL